MYATFFSNKNINCNFFHKNSQYNYKKTKVVAKNTLSQIFLLLNLLIICKANASSYQRQIYRKIPYAYSNTATAALNKQLRHIKGKPSTSVLLSTKNASFDLPDCASILNSHEAFYGIPKKLLHAIALVESGRRSKDGFYQPHPWTINVEGKGYIFDTKEAAIKATELHLKKNKSVDVGCMQVNLKHHPHAFKNLEEAFDPWANIAYALSFLKKLKDSLGSWEKAVAHYHSASPNLNKPYLQRVLKAWTGLIKNTDGIQKLPSLHHAFKKKDPTLYKHKILPHLIFARYLNEAKNLKAQIKVAPFQKFKESIKNPIRFLKPPTLKDLKPINGQSSSPTGKVNYAAYKVYKVNLNGRAERVKFFSLK